MGQPVACAAFFCVLWVKTNIINHEGSKLAEREREDCFMCRTSNSYCMQLWKPVGKNRSKCIAGDKRLREKVCTYSVDIIVNVSRTPDSEPPPLRRRIPIIIGSLYRSLRNDELILN